MNKLVLLSLLALSACSKNAIPDSPLEAAARQTCKATIEARAINKNSIAYLSDDTSSAVTKAANGQLTLTLKFSAKNEQGMASSLVARCTVSDDGKKMIDIAVKEGR